MIVPHSHLQEFTRVAEWRMKPDDDPGLFELRHLLRTLAFDCDFLPETINAELHEILRDPLELPAAWQYDHVVCAAYPLWRLCYGFLPPSDEFIRSNTANAVIAVLGKDPLVVDFYRPSQDIDSDVFDPAASLTPAEREIFKPGELCMIDASREIADIVGDTPTAVLWLTGRTRRTIQWLFSRHTLKSVQAVASVAADADAVSLIRALAELRSAAAVPTLCALASHDSHLVRAEALQALAALDAEGARASLQRAADDAHPQVRALSSKFIAALAA